MSLNVPDNVHIVPLGVEYDRVVQPPIDANADRVVLLRYLPEVLQRQVRDEDIHETLCEHGITVNSSDVRIDDLFDAVAVFGRVLRAHVDDRVYVNLATGNKVTAIGGMIACMVDSGAKPYYVEAKQHGSHHPPAPKGVSSVDAIPPYPIERPEYQHLKVMDYLASSDRTNADGEPYRIKRTLFEFGQTEGLDFMSDYEGETQKGKFRRLQAHVLDPLQKKGYVKVTEVGTQRRVFLTEDGRNTLRAFRYLLE